MLKLPENELLELASLDVDGKDLLKYVSNKHKDWHPIKCIEFLDELYKDKRYQKLVTSLISIKLQRVRSNLLKSVDDLMQSGDTDIVKSIDKLLQVVLKFTKIDDEDDSSNRIIIEYTDGKQEKFKKEISQ